jgi:hypothetical protein
MTITHIRHDAIVNGRAIRGQSRHTLHIRGNANKCLLVRGKNSGRNCRINRCFTSQNKDRGENSDETQNDDNRND